MDNAQFIIEKEKSEIRYRYYKNLVAYPEWTYFIKDMEEQVAFHSVACAGYSQQNKPFDAARQAAIIIGIEEALARPKDVITRHENVFNKFVTKICALCGTTVHRAQRIFTGNPGK